MVTYADQAGKDRGLHSGMGIDTPTPMPRFGGSIRDLEIGPMCPNTRVHRSYLKGEIMMYETRAAAFAEPQKHGGLPVCVYGVADSSGVFYGYTPDQWAALTYPVPAGMVRHVTQYRSEP